MIATTFSLVATGFVATNLDNLVLVIGWILAARLSPRQIFAGYVFSMSAVLGIAMIFGIAGYFFPAQYMGYLGVIPVLLGVRMMADLWRQPDGRQSIGPDHTTLALPGMILTLLSNSVDSVLVFAPFVADSNPEADILIAIAFMSMVFLWFGLALYASKHARRINALKKAGEWIAPLIMIIVGLYILDNTLTDVMPGS